MTDQKRTCYQIEPLEARICLASFTVINTNDSGAGSLRQAILDANTAMGTNTIGFDASFSASPHTITFTTPTQQINGKLTISGPGASLLTVTRSGNVTASSKLFNSFASVLTMTGMTVTGGNINGSGGGISVAGVSPNVTLDGMVITGNVATGDGGGINVNNSATLTVRNSVISNNSGRLGGGICFFQNGSLVVENSTISGNSASGVSGHDASGGGISFDGTALASPPAGYTASTLLLRSSTFSNNTASHSGGGVSVDDFVGTLLVQNCTFTSNTAGTSGGGIWCTGQTVGTGSVTLQDCTVVSNTANGTAAGTGGGGVARVGSFAGSINLLGTIVYGNSNANALDILASSSTTTSANFCDIGSAAGYTLSGSSGNNLPIGSNPMLSALAGNGGSTQTMALTPASPCINTGTTISGITTDQRGVARPQGTTPDIGAYERQATAATLQAMASEYLNRQAVTFSFNNDASVSFTRSSYSILNRTTNQTLTSIIGTLSFSSNGTQATLVLTNLLSDANYRVSSGGLTLDFFVLAADANQDRKVDLTDFTVLAANFNQTGRNYSQGEFSYDGKVDLTDFTMLASNFNRMLMPAPAAPAAMPAPLAAKQSLMLASLTPEPWLLDVVNQ